MKILKFLFPIVKSLFKTVPGSSIVEKVKNTFSKDKPDTKIQLAAYLVGGLITWYAIYKGLVDEDIVLKVIKSIF